MFVTLISAVSAVAFNAYAALPEDYVYLTVSGIYHCHVGRGSQEYNPPPIVQVRVLTHSFTYDQVDSVDEATHMTYPSIPFNIQKIQGYVNGTLIAEYSTINKDFDPATGEIVYTFTATPVWRSTTKLRYHMNLSPEHVYIATDQNHQSYTYPTDPANICMGGNT